MPISREEDIRFKGAVKKSRNGVELVKTYFEKLGFQTELPELKIRDKFEDRAGYGDDADLFIISKLGERMGIEVKGRTLSFTSVRDFPFPTIFVDRVNKADASTVRCYVSINSAGTHFAAILSSTKDLWVQKQRYDNVKGHTLNVYECPKQLIKFLKIKK